MCRGILPTNFGLHEVNIMPILQKNKQRNINPARTIVFSFLMIIIVGTLLLCMPFSSRSGEFTPLDVSFFTATSATCVTGLVLVDTNAHWSYFGQGLILAMIQLGGLGFVTFVSFFNFILGRKVGLRRMQLASESINTSGSFGNIKYLLRVIIQISLTVELVGAIMLSFVFVPEFGKIGIFKAAFISVSAFCNAGFDILSRGVPFVSLTGFANNSYVIIVVMMLIICGGLGFVVWYDLIEYRKTKHLELHTKIVLIVSAVLICSGALLFALIEWNNPETLAGMSGFDKIVNSFFQSVTCRTAGFNSVDLGELNPLSKIFMTMLMYIGASSGSTGGGIKVTTIVVLIMTVVCVFRRKQDTIILGRRVSKEVVYRSISLIMVTLVLCFISSIIVFYTSCAGNGLSGVDAAFESVSAFSTTGLSTGVTGHLNLLSKVWLTIIMFVGRVGPISFVLSIADVSENSKNSVVPEGKIIVG